MFRFSSQEEIPEAFAAHKGQFEVHKPKPKPAARDPKEVFLAWLREQMDAHLEAPKRSEKKPW